MKNVILVFLLSVLVFSCKKTSDEDEEYYTITVTVLDWDSKAPIAGATVLTAALYMTTPPPADSAISDINGKATFRIKMDRRTGVIAYKKNYVSVDMNFGVGPYIDREQTMYLARKSFINVTLHKAATYLPSDSISFLVSKDFHEPYLANYFEFNSQGRSLAFDKANSPDKLFNLYSVYNYAYNTKKLYFHFKLIRNGVEVSHQFDSTDMIQFGTKNYTYNY